MFKQKQDILTLTITFNPKIERLLQQAEIIAEATNFHVIVDNNSENISDLQEKLSPLIDKKKLIILKLPANLGIAHAINEGIKIAFTRKEAMLLILDHDSLPTKSMIEQIYKDYNTLAASGVKVATVGPLISDDRIDENETPLKIVEARNYKPSMIFNNLVPVEHIITSGSIYNKTIFKEVGLMKESFFIDFVDIEWCLRAKSKGYISFVSKSATLRHQLGDRIINVIFNKKIHIHSPLRNYYFFRNLIRMLKLKYIPLAVRWRMMKQCCKIFVSILLFAPEKLERGKFILKAIKDA